MLRMRNTKINKATGAELCDLFHHELTLEAQHNVFFFGREFRSGEIDYSNLHSNVERSSYPIKEFDFQHSFGFSIAKIIGQKFKV